MVAPFAALPLAVFVALIALMLAYSVTLLLRPLLQHLDAIPAIGGWLADKINGIEAAVVRGLLAFVHASEVGVVLLLAAPAVIVRRYAADVRGFALDVEDAFDYVRHHAVPALIHAAVHPVAVVAHDAYDLAKEAKGAGAAGAVKLTKRLDALRTYVDGHAVAPLAHFLGKVWPDAKRAIDAAEHATTVTLPGEINAARKLAQGVADEITAAEGAVAGELPRIGGLDIPDLENLLEDVPWTRLAGLLAAVPLLRALVRTLVNETGLTNRACRGKVKDVCGSDPRLWENLLAGLAPIGFAFSLEEMYRVAEELTRELAPLIREAS